MQRRWMGRIGGEMRGIGWFLKLEYNIGEIHLRYSSLLLSGHGVETPGTLVIYGGLESCTSGVFTHIIRCIVMKFYHSFHSIYVLFCYT